MWGERKKLSDVRVDLKVLTFTPFCRSKLLNKLSTEFVFKNSLTESKLNENDLMETNLGLALKCVSQEEIIEGTIYAYHDWSEQPYCDLILAQFETTKILSIYQ